MGGCSRACLPLRQLLALTDENGKHEVPASQGRCRLGAKQGERQERTRADSHGEAQPDDRGVAEGVEEAAAAEREHGAQLPRLVVERRPGVAGDGDGRGARGGRGGDPRLVELGVQARLGGGPLPARNDAVDIGAVCGGTLE